MSKLEVDKKTISILTMGGVDVNPEQTYSCIVEFWKWFENDS